ncbi:hypothetical protein WCQ02_31080 [Paraburkholderia tropica]|uniref:hypothetical protein n=1 Tax=Paraburkholderia tropica TaxID=92647 RepID=UPI003017857B
MATATVPSFAPTAAVNLPVGVTSANVVIPTTGTPQAAIVTNIGEHTTFVQMGVGNTTAATTATSLAITPGDSIALTIGTNTYIAGITLSGQSQLNIAVGS